MEDENIFDEDDVIDCILLEEDGNEEKKSNSNTGCLSVFIVLLIPFSTIICYFLFWVGLT